MELISSPESLYRRSTSFAGVVDQPGHVACGKANFANEELHFYPTIDDCRRKENPNVLLFSGVLQYLREPYAFLENALRAEIPYDR